MKITLNKLSLNSLLHQKCNCIFVTKYQLFKTEHSLAFCDVCYKITLKLNVNTFFSFQLVTYLNDTTLKQVVDEQPFIGISKKEYTYESNLPFYQTETEELSWMDSALANKITSIGYLKEKSSNNTQGFFIETDGFQNLYIQIQKQDKSTPTHFVDYHFVVTDSIENNLYKEAIEPTENNDTA